MKTGARKPGRSLLLSLLFTGLGQMYNGELAKGAAFCLMRAVALAALPVSVMERPAAPSAGTALWLVAAVLAPDRGVARRGLHPRAPPPRICPCARTGQCPGTAPSRPRARC